MGVGRLRLAIDTSSLYIIISILPGKNLKNDGNQKIILADKANFSFDFGLILVILRRFLPHNDGNQLPECQLFFQK